MKFVKLLTHARVNGVLRSPAEGALHLSDDEAQRLIDAEAAIDVSDGFDADQHDAPAEHLTTVANNGTVDAKVDTGDSQPGRHQADLSAADIKGAATSTPAEPTKPAKTKEA